MAKLVSKWPQDIVKSPIINDFSIRVATANGTGSTTANLTILRALFKMGIPAHGKNIFPSNIQGLPTWYHIRVAQENNVAMARPEKANVIIAFNLATFDEDVSNLSPDDVCIYNGDWRGKKPPALAENATETGSLYYPLPVNEFVRESGMKGKLRNYIANMVYVGALAQLLEIPLLFIEEALNYNLKGKTRAVKTNFNIAKKAFDWSKENFKKIDPYYVKPMNKTEGQILLTGNEAAALGAIYGGVTLASWYPITPSTSLIEALSDYLPKFRPDNELGNKTYAVVQAEDEIAAIGMVVGAGWAGARAMTATSGPGISLMSEFAGLSYFAEVPAVIWDVQRIGPSTGLPTRTGQCDVTFAYYLGHGDSKHVLLFPSDLEECFEFAIEAFDLAEQLQTLVLVLSDLDLGMNHWMSKPLKTSNKPFKRGKILSAEDIEAKGEFARYFDVDGDGITYRTLPGNEHSDSAYFTRGTGHDDNAKYSEHPADWENNMLRLKKKFQKARQLVPKPILEKQEEAKVGIIAFGSTKFAVSEARDKLLAEGIATDFMRLRALPINDEVENFVENYEQVYVIELNRDGQIHGILQNEMPKLANRLISLAHLDGLPLSAGWVVEKMTRHLMEHGFYDKQSTKESKPLFAKIA